jgi:hypothetical protein
LELGASRADLCSIVRWASYEAAFEMTMLLEDPGIRRSEIAGLHESLLSADPSGREGRPQPAPKAKASKPTPRPGSGGKREPAGKVVVYKTLRDFKNFQYFLPKSAGDFDLLRLAGDSRTFKWNPPQVVIEKSVAKRKKGDNWNFNSQPLIFSMRAAEALEKLLKPVGRLLPLVHEGEEYRVLQVTAVIDCLDPSQTLVQYYDDTPKPKQGTMKDAIRIVGKDNVEIMKPAFALRRLGKTAVFKIPQNPAFLFVRESFKRAVEDAELQGFEFKEVWRQP